MKISILQPKIIRGNVDHNIMAIQGLIDQSVGDILVLGEYALTGSLVLESDVDIHDWADKSRNGKSRLIIPEGKKLLINSLVEVDGEIYNCCELLPSSKVQCKLFLDKPELDAGISPGIEQRIFEINDKRFKVIICTDLRTIDKIKTDNLDFIFYIFHFSNYNFNGAMQRAKDVSSDRDLPVLISSLTSDKNIGFSSYVYKNTIVSLPNSEGILEINID